jgi:aspartyl-tRNA(Asn)/glutamyl-tRNA(Gln) amidotransferase subunit A
MASSLDHIGVLTKTVEDAVLLMTTVSGEDSHDATSISFTDEEKNAWNASLLRNDLQGKKIAVPKQFFAE